MMTTPYLKPSLELTSGTPTMQSPLTASSYSDMVSKVSGIVDSMRMRGSVVKKRKTKTKTVFGEKQTQNKNVGRTDFRASPITAETIERTPRDHPIQLHPVHSSIKIPIPMRL